MASHATAVKVQQLPMPKIVVFGVDDDSRPHAAWFGKPKAEAAKAAARQLGFNVAEATNGLAADITGKIQEGRIHASGPHLIPIISEAIYEQIVTVLNARGQAGQSQPAGLNTALPETWDAIKPGHLVIARESLVLGWWEAVVVARAGDKLTLRWRDYPKLPERTVPVTAVALLHPKP